MRVEGNKYALAGIDPERARLLLFRGNIRGPAP